MAYIILFAGIILVLYSLVAICIKQKEVPFEDTYSETLKSSGETSMLYELEKKVELQLAKLCEQKELVTQLMLRAEKKLAELDDKAAQAFVPEKKWHQSSADSLERARLHNDIYLMYDQGIPLVDIARQVGRGKGEVQLVLGLRN